MDLTAEKARLASAIYSNLENPEFMSSFFDDPTSIELFDSSNVVLMATMAWDFFESLLVGHFDWLADFLERKPDVRRTLALEFPEILLRAAHLSDDPSLDFLKKEWRSEIVDGIERSSSSTRIGMAMSYPEEMEQLGL
jgi:hypothetical protein